MITKAKHRDFIDSFLKLIQPKIINKNFIRLGSLYDGGYVVVDDFKNTDYLVSLGVDDDINFEKDILSRISGVDFYDNSIAELPENLKNSRFFNETIGKDHTTITQCISRIKSESDLILKMDIEGSEWNSLEEINSQSLNRFRQIIVELHDIHNILKIKESDFDLLLYEKAKNVLEKILKTHLPVHAHINTYGSLRRIANQVVPDVVEITYIRKLEIKNNYTNVTRPQSEILDMPNDKDHLPILFQHIG